MAVGSSGKPSSSTAAATSKGKKPATTATAPKDIKQSSSLQHSNPASLSVQTSGHVEDGATSVSHSQQSATESVFSDEEEKLSE